MSEQFYTAICEQCGILFRENPGRCPDCGSDEILVLSACDGELLVLADNPEIKIDQTWWNEEQKRFHRLLRLFWDDLDRLKSIDGTLLSGTKTAEAESEAVALAKRWLTNFPLENYASSLAGIRLRQALNLVTARLRGDAGVPDSASLREMVASLSGGTSVPDSLIPNLEAERDARVRLEEAEQARRDARRELEKAVAVTRDMLALVASIRETWNTRPLSLGEALDASPIPGEAKLPVLDAWRSWEKARSVESDGNAALGTLERELAALPVSPERTAFDETGIELHPVDGVPGIFDVAAALNARGDRMREFADWENAEPKFEDVPVPNTARPSIPEDVNLKRHATENVLSAASRPVAFLFRNAKYWAIVGGVLFLAFWWIPPLGRWAYGEDESFWRAAFWMFLEFFGPLLAFVWRWHREEIERMRLYSEWADKTVGERLSELERTHSASGDLTELLAELSKKRSWAKSVTKDSIRIVKETQGFRTLPDWLSDAEERSKNIKARLFKTWEDVLDAVAAAATLEDRKSELARRTAVWSERGEALAARRRETLELLRTAVESTRGQIAAKRETLETATKSAAATVDAALSAFSAWTETADSKAEKARAVAEVAIREADQARRAWVDAKAATDAAVAKAEAEETKRAEVRIEFTRLKNRKVPQFRARLEAVRASSVTDGFVARIDRLEGLLSEWEETGDPRSGDLAEEERVADKWNAEIGRIEEDWRTASAHADRRRGLWETYRGLIAPLRDFADGKQELGRPVWETDWKRGDESFSNGKPIQALDLYERTVDVARKAVDALGNRERTLSTAEEIRKRSNVRRAFLLDRAPTFPETEFEQQLRSADAAILRGRFTEAQNGLLALSRLVRKHSEACEQLLEKCYNKVFAGGVLRKAGQEAFYHASVSIQRRVFETELDDPEILAVRPPGFPWMSPAERNGFPDPVELVRSAGDFEEAGSLYGRLWTAAVRWCGQWKGVFLVSEDDDAADRHRDLLVDATRSLVRIDGRPSDSLADVEREVAWFLETSDARRVWAKRKEIWDGVLNGPARIAFDPAWPSATAERARECVTSSRAAVLAGDYGAAGNALVDAISAGPELTARGWSVTCRNARSRADEAGADADESEGAVRLLLQGERELDESRFEESIRSFEAANRQFSIVLAQAKNNRLRAVRCRKEAETILMRLEELPVTDSNERFVRRTKEAAMEFQTCLDERKWKRALEVFYRLKNAELETAFRKERAKLEECLRNLTDCDDEECLSAAKRINRILSSLDDGSFFEIQKEGISDPKRIVLSVEEHIDRFASNLLRSWMNRHPDDILEAEAWEDLEQTLVHAPPFLMDRQWRICDDKWISWISTISRRPFVRLFCKEIDSSGLVPEIDPKAVLSIFRAPGRERILDYRADSDDFGINGLNLLAQIAEPPYDGEFSKEADLRKWRHS